MNKTLRLSLTVAALVLAAFVMALAGHLSRDRNALKHYKAELQAKGEKLTWAELAERRDTNINNSQALLTNAVAGFGVAGLPPSALELRKFVGPGKARVVWLDDAPFGNTSGTGPGQGTWEQLATELETNRAPLQQVRDALRDPAADAGPPTSYLTGRRVNFVALRLAAQWLIGEAMCELRQGHLEAALQDLEAEGALARLNREEYTLVAQMIRNAMANLGLAATWEALQAPGWNEPQLKRLQRAWEPVDLFDALEKGFLGERAAGAEIWGEIRGTNFNKTWAILTLNSSRSSLEQVMEKYVLFPAYKLTSINEDELFHLQTMQDMVSGVRLLKAGRPWQEAKARMDLVNVRVNRVFGSAGSFRYWLSARAIPNFTKAYRTAVHGEAERRLTIAAIALKRYQLRHGEAPRSLQDLVPEFLAKVPTDPMTAEPMRYRRNTDGTFVLYSAGEDGIDDGGDPTPVKPGGFGLWEGRDAVWPLGVAGESSPARPNGE